MLTDRNAPHPDPHAIHVAAVIRAIEAMRHQPAQPHPLAALAQVARFSPFYFHQIFRDVTAVTPARFLAALRMAAACRLLLHSGLPVGGVAAHVGYQSAGTFTFQFGRLLGISPSRFRAVARRLANQPAGTVTAALHGQRREPAPTASTMVLGAAPPAGSLVCSCLVPAGGGRVVAGRWAVAGGAPVVALPEPPDAGDYAAYCVVVAPGVRLTDALVDDVPGSLLLSRAPVRRGGRPPRPGGFATLRCPAPTDLPLVALTPLARAA